MITIPKQYYVGLKSQHQDDSELPLGFATPYEDNAAFRKRKETVDSWARPYGIWNPTTRRHDPVEGLEPRVHENIPLDGFKIAESVRRVYWGGGNVVWRVVDPRGYELEISSANVARILDCTTLVNGVIQVPCVWGREKAQNVLLPVNSEPYIEATKATKRVATKLSIKDVSPGDVVELKDGRIVKYLGFFHILMSSVTSSKDIHAFNDYSNTSVYNFLTVKKRHFFETVLSADTKKRWRFTSQGFKDGDAVYEVASDLHASAIVKKADTPLDVNETASTINRWFEKYELSDGVEETYFVSATSINPSEFQLTFVPDPIGRLRGSQDYGRRPFSVVKVDDDYYLCGTNYSDSVRAEVVNINNVLANKLTIAYNHNDRRRSYARVRFSGREWFKLVVVHNGRTYEPKGYFGV